MARTVALNLVKGTLSGGEPKIGRVTLPAFIDFSAGPDDVTFDFAQVETNQLWSPCKSVYINNSVNPSGLTLKITQTQEVLVMPPLSSGVLPLALQPGSTVEIVSAGGLSTGNLTNVVGLTFFNFDVAPFVYAGFAPFTSGSTVVMEGRDGLTAMGDNNPLVTALAASTPTLRSVALVAATATDVFPVVVAATGKRFRNIGDAAGTLTPAFYRINANAVGAFPDFYLPADANWVILPYRTLRRISFFSAGAVQIEAEEF